MSTPLAATTTRTTQPSPETAGMRAMWLVEPGKFELRYQPIYDPAPDQVLMRIAYCGICPWDLRVYLGKKQVPLPRVMGHEASGTIVGVGSSITQLQIGQRIVGDFIVKCGVCSNCRSGRSNRCLNPRFPNGAYEEFAVLPQQNIHPIQKTTTSLKAAAFMEPLACVFRGQRMLRLSPGETELVVGAGPIGLMHLQIAKMFGARVMAADLIPERLELARRLGADAILDSSAGDLKRAVLDWTNGRGADAAAVTVGASPVVTQAAECLADGGRLNIFAGVYPSAPLGIEPNLIHYKELIITGSSDSTPEDMHAALSHIESGAVKVEPLISHVVPIERISEGFDLVSNRQGMKVMVEVGGDVV